MIITAAETAVPASAAPATAPQSPARAPASAVDLAGRAARACLARAGVPASSVGVLVNVGVYREHNTFEPAMAALVQKEIGINLDYIADPEPAAGFSFDLMNGACGVLNAVQVGQALLETGSTDRLLITAADVHPAGDADRDAGYPYADLAGAFLLERSAEPGAGFGPVRHYTADRPTDVEGYLDTGTMGTRGRTTITVRREPGHRARLTELAARAVTEYAEEFGLDLDRTLVIGPSARTAASTAGTGARAGTWAEDGPGVRAGAGGEPHTAAPVLGYLRAMDGARRDDYDRFLFVSAGAGPSAACAAYRPEGW
ncbi:3-Oxoacyl-(acyl-carrier-protein (ACP)) synthase III [Actinobacteria bacterium OV450]|nr:3-Oxoacyl-(acyl-carrier-protein (ACP)) synthase III [Actinobacteria bacterium OV450]